MATIRRKKSEPFAIIQKEPGPWPQVLINWLATLAVIIVFGLITMINPNYMGEFFVDQRLIVAGIGGLIWMSLGAFIMAKMVSFEI